MKSEKRSYYIDIKDRLISQDPIGSEWNFKIEATDQEIGMLSDFFEKNRTADWETFRRAHVPFREHHKDIASDHYDSTIEQIYAIIYRLGDDRAKRHIESMGILPDGGLSSENRV